MRFLIVDDFEITRMIIKNELASLGFQAVMEADNGQKAVEILEASIKANKPIEFIFCDWNMPIMNGLELLQIVKKDSRLQNLPFVMVTAEGELKSVLEAVDAGVTEYIVKPIKSDQLQKKIHRLLKKD